MADPTLDTDVLVVGAGPCGITMANLLGVYGVQAIVIDRDREIPAFPRAVGIDDESLRTCQAVEMADDVLFDCIQNTSIRYHTSWGRCFAAVKPSAQPFGWPRRNLFLQPLFERTMRKGATRFDNISVRLGHELTGLTQTTEGVSAEVTDADGTATTINAKYLVGTDGGRSTVRRLIDIELTGKTAPVKWLVVDVCDDELDAPYSAVYCDPEQPVLVVPLPYGHRRWEFKLRDSDDDVDMARPEHVMELLAPRYLGRRMPTIVSSRVYLHHSRIAERFQSGRVFLAGDAAHLQPPFFGQGMNSGIRDVTNLAWKLAAVVTQRAEPRIVDTYDVERRAHAAAMVGFATRIGQLYSPRNTVTEHARDLLFRALHLIPGGKDYVLQMKYKPMPRYTRGIVVGVDTAKRSLHPVGRMFNQPAVETLDRRRMKLDDAIGTWFAVIGIGNDPTQHLSTEARQWWSGLGARFVRIESPRSRRLPSEGDDLGPRASGPDETLTLIDVVGGFSDWKLTRPDDEVIILRPDRYVAGVSTTTGLEALTRELRAVMDSAPHEART